MIETLVLPDVKLITPPRFADSRLDRTRLAGTFGLGLPDWRNATNRVIDTMLTEDAA